MTDVFDAGDSDLDDSAYALDGEDTGDTGAGGGDADLGEGQGGEPKPEGDPKPALTLEQLQARERQKTTALRQERQRSRSLEERLRTLEAGAQGGKDGTKPADDVGERPDPAVDPLGYLQWIDKRMSAAEQRTQAEAATTQQQRQTQAQIAEIKTRVEEFEADFKETTPDYDTAIDHLLAARKADLIATGLDDAAAERAVGQEFLGITARAMAAGKDPAEVVYGLAKHRGYSKDQTAETEGKLETVRAGQKAASPLGGSGGRGNGDLSIGSINNLKGKAFDDAAKKLEDRMIRMERGF